MTPVINKINALVLTTFAECDDAAQLWEEETTQKALKAIVSAMNPEARRKKDPNAPKRGKSGYLYFCSEFRAKIKQELGADAKATDVTRELGVKWNIMKGSTKAADKKMIVGFNKLAAADKERYQKQKAVYVPPEDAEPPRRRGGKKKKTDGPKRAKSAYLYYCSEFRDVVKEELGEGAKVTEITKELGARWNGLKEDKTRAAELAKFEQSAAEDRARYQAEKASIGSTQPPTQTNKKTATKKTAKTEKKPAPKKKASPVVDEVLEEEIVEEEEIVAPKPKVGKSDKKTDKDGPVNGYQAYCSAKRAGLKEQFPKAKASEITKKLSAGWKAQQAQQAQQAHS